MIAVGEGEDNLLGQLEAEEHDPSRLETVREEDEEADESAGITTTQKSSSPAPYAGPVSLKRRASSPSDSPSKRPRLNEPPSDCTAPNPPPPTDEYMQKAGEYANVYLAEGWRDRWCACQGDSGCRAYFDQLPYFLEEEEEIQVEEDKDSRTLSFLETTHCGSFLIIFSAEKSLHDLGMQAFSSLPRDQAIDGLQAYGVLREKVMAFLRPFAEGGQVVTKDAITEFFEAQREERRKALRASGAIL